METRLSALFVPARTTAFAWCEKKRPLRAAATRPLVVADWELLGREVFGFRAHRV